MLFRSTSHAHLLPARPTPVRPCSSIVCRNGESSLLHARCTREYVGDARCEKGYSATDSHGIHPCENSPSPMCAAMCRRATPLLRPTPHPIRCNWVCGVYPVLQLGINNICFCIAALLRRCISFTVVEKIRFHTRTSQLLFNHIQKDVVHIETSRYLPWVRQETACAWHQLPHQCPYQPLERRTKPRPRHRRNRRGWQHPPPRVRSAAKMMSSTLD